ncbi:GntR family transcriptional regulator [Ancylobacter mangrovi]|uniref:GntR family transcriptional regulator n=1 Tax=Ancylobacter mangrovi TaxID=2972472 RepID=UPI002162B090|nr:GntR family transcriptional regulator [Ancylobacter mangrovi]MCS0503428.1 GntR family transcriptional regulator [Ancylobacter mangrovi]
MNPSTANIEEAILSAILAGRINPGTRLGEQKLADLFGVSRTRVREAMMRLETRGIVQVSARRGWFVIEPSAEEAREAFQTRRVIETGLLQTLRRVPPEVVRSLKEHVAFEREAIDAGDVQSRACLLGDFHIHLADALGNRLLTEIIRDLTARTTLISMLYQPTEKAEESSHDHGDIVAALETGDIETAARLMDEHIAKVEAGLDLTAKPDPLAGLRELLTPSTFAGAPPSIPSPNPPLARAPSGRRPAAPRAHRHSSRKED